MTPKALSREKETFYISFYTEHNSLLNERLVVEAVDQMDKRLHTKAQKKGKELGAEFYHIFRVIPRRWYIEKDDY